MVGELYVIYSMGLGVAMTTVFKMAERYVAGDRSPNKGKSCNRCAYLSICDSKP